MDDDEFYQLLSFIRLSEYRQNILQHFQETGAPDTPKDISRATDISLTHVSRHLIKLKERNLVTVVNPDAPRHRYYKLTEKGRELVERLEATGYLS